MPGKYLTGGALVFCMLSFIEIGVPSVLGACVGGFDVKSCKGTQENWQFKLGTLVAFGRFVCLNKNETRNSRMEALLACYNRV